MAVSKVYKRDGRLVDFEPEKIKAAMHKAFKATEVDESGILDGLTVKVVSESEKRFKSSRRFPHIEEIQDIVVKTLMVSGQEKTANAYANYR
ncbi:TPA: ribonucleoside triphosphate reductase, partial [Candidatus Woesearchaeota archaeon]|nr:ribonucleoside triphosphate reductase [Candidatus Woesearchaeota archaeon]